MKLAFADIYEYVSDPATMRVKPSQMLDHEYLKDRAKLIDMKKAQDPKFGTPPSGGTVYLTAADASGMMVSYIQSNYTGFGSGIVVNGTGISLQNRGYGFSLRPGHANIVAPNKRPFQTIIPAFVTQRRQAGDELRRHGRLDAGAGPRAGDGALRRLPPEPAGRGRRAALAHRHRPHGRHRARHGCRM